MRGLGLLGLEAFEGTLIDLYLRKNKDGAGRRVTEGLTRGWFRATWISE